MVCVVIRLWNHDIQKSKTSDCSFIIIITLNQIVREVLSEESYDRNYSVKRDIIEIEVSRSQIHQVGNLLLPHHHYSKLGNH
jgi:hypothetical protein